MSNYAPYRWCVASECKNTSVKTQHKLWIQVPVDINMRNTWLKVARRDPELLSDKSRLYFCEDHFDLEHDMENYIKYKIMGSVKRIKMKPNCIPSRFVWNRKHKILNESHPTEAKIRKRQRVALPEDSYHDYIESENNGVSSYTEAPLQIMKPIKTYSRKTSLQTVSRSESIQNNSHLKIKDEPEWAGDPDVSLGVKQEACPELYAGHKVEAGVVLGPEGPQPPDSAFARLDSHHKIKDEPEWAGDPDVSLGVKQEACPELYAGHKVESDVVLGPEGPQPPDSAFARLDNLQHIKDEPEWAGDPDVSFGVKQEACPELYAGHQVEADVVLGPEGPQPPDSAFARPENPQHIKDEPSWGDLSDSGVKQEACPELYAGHQVEADVVLGPEGPQPPDSAFARPVCWDLQIKNEEPDNLVSTEPYDNESSHLRRRTQKAAANPHFSEDPGQHSEDTPQPYDQESSTMNTSKQRKKYTDVQLQSALSAIKEGRMGVAEASQAYNIPKTTLRDKIHNKYPDGATPGAKRALTKNEEDHLVSWILHLTNMGFLVTKHNFLKTVKDLVEKLNRENPFKNGKPGRYWYEGFMARHPELTGRISQNLIAPRTNVTEESIRAWFGRTITYLQEENLEEVLTDPRRIFNCDESAFYLSPKENSVIVKKGERQANDEEECLTVLMTVSADGNMQPSMVLVPNDLTPANIMLNMPLHWAIGRSDGWMTGETFHEYITNVFYPWLIENDIGFPVILCMDGHSSYINLPLFEFCREKKIVLVALLPSSSHDLQPLDVAVFRTLKDQWNEHCYNQDTKLKREDFSKELDKCLKSTTLNDAIINGFKTCGLYPFGPDIVDYNKLIKNNKDKTEVTDLSKEARATFLLTEVEMRIPENDLKEFRMSGDTWLGDPKNHALFYFWKKVNDDCLQVTSDHEDT